MRLLSKVAVGMLLYGAAPIGAQCPDGTPPPCVQVKRVAAAPKPLPPAIDRSRRFILLPFRNVTQGAPQAWLVTGAPLMLGDVLSRFRELTVVPEARLTAARRRLSIAVEAEPDANQLRRLADETDGWTAITGGVIAAGGKVRLSAQAMDIATAKELVRAEVELTPDADPREAFNRLGVKLLEAAGIKVAAADSLALPTNSLAAYQAYVRGIELTQRSAFVRAQAALTEAVLLDSTFALAWARLAEAAMGWNAQVIVDPRGSTIRALAQASRFASRLPLRQALLIRSLQSFFSGQTTRARALADSLVRTDIDDLDAAEFLAVMEMIDPMVDTTRTPVRLKASLNKAITLARGVLERDPGRRYMYSIPVYAYGIAGGVWWAQLGGVARETGSFATMFGMSSAGTFVPVLGPDSLSSLPMREFARLPAADTTAARKRGLEAAQLWVDRWIAAGPSDAEAHLWASRLADLRGDPPSAMRELETAESLGIESSMESIPGRRIRLHVRLGEYVRAGELADSLLSARVLGRRPIVPVIDRGRRYAIAALFLTKRFASAGALAESIVGEGSPPCVTLANDLYPGNQASLDISIIRAVMDTVVSNFGKLSQVASLARCAEEYATNISFDSASWARASAGRAMLRTADSLYAAGNSAHAYRAARGAWRADSASLATANQRSWFVQRSRQLAIGSQFVLDSAIIAGDSVVFAFRRSRVDPLWIDSPGLATAWGIQARVPAAFGKDSLQFLAQFEYTAAPRDSGRAGDVAELVSAASSKRAFILPPTSLVQPGPAGLVATATGFNAGVQCPCAAALQRLRHPLAYG